MSDSKNARNFALLGFAMGLVSIPASVIILGLFPAILGFASSMAARNRQAPWWMTLPGFFCSAIGIASSALMTLAYVIALGSGEGNALKSQWVGVRCPDFKFESSEGKVTTLADYKGKPLVIVQFATWCPPCVAEIPDLNRLNKSESLNIFAMSNEDMQTIKGGIKKFQMEYPVGQIKTKHPAFSQVQYIPNAFILNADGVIQDVLSGGHSYEDFKKAAFETTVIERTSDSPKEKDWKDKLTEFVHSLNL